MHRIALLLIALVAPAQAATLDLAGHSQGTLAPAQSTTGVSLNEANFGVSGTRGAAVFQLRNTAGSATVELQVNCLQTTTDWIVIPNSSTVLGVTAAVLDIVRPGCRYRANVTACSGCALTVTVTSIGQ